MNKSMFPWETQTGTGDGPASGYNQDEANEFFRLFDVATPSIEGVVPRRLNEFAPSVNVGLTSIDIDTGVSYCYGRYWNDISTTNLTPPAFAANTAGRVVLQADWATNLIRPVIIMATVGVLVPPAVTQTAGTLWEISLCSFAYRASDGQIFPDAAALGAGTPNGVTDERTWVGERNIKRFIPATGGVNITDSTALRISLGALAGEPSYGIFAPANKLSFATGALIVPHDYLDIVSIDTIIDYTGAPGNMAMDTSVTIVDCPGTATGGPTTGTVVVPTPINLGCVLQIISGTGITTEKIMNMSTTRNGLAGTDTAANGVGIYGWLIEYRSRGFL